MSRTRGWWLIGMVIVMSGTVSSALAGEPPPSGAVVLFDGMDLSKWQHGDGAAARWKLVDDGAGGKAMQVQGGDVQTKDKFTDFRLHIEFRTPQSPPHVTGQGRGNSGVYIQSRYEVQVLDSFGVDPIGMGDCGSIYGVKIADVNASTAPETWQTYDIDFTAARFDATGKKTGNARVSVRHNGQVIHDDVEIPGPTGGGAPESPDPGPIRLQDHGNPVQYRNIWIVPR